MQDDKPDSAQDIDIEKVRIHCENKVANDTAVVSIKAIHQNYIVNERFPRLTLTVALSNIGTKNSFNPAMRRLYRFVNRTVTGGLLGLCTGMSFLSVFEITFWVGRIFIEIPWKGCTKGMKAFTNTDK